MTRPADLRIENGRLYWSTVLTKWAAPVLAVLLGIEVLISAALLVGRTDPLGVLALCVRGAVVIGLAIVAVNAWQRAQVEAIEFSDRFRFFVNGRPIAYDWNQLAALWYEGIRNPSRIEVTAVKPNANEDRVLVVGLRGGSDVRIRVGPPQQVHVLEWAEFLEQRLAPSDT